ncbi:MAG: uracil phosphoribosyltransferase [Bacteroidia bacterium]|jgi:uracil phosphoribosyltransferase|nr:uracil phosphoribosyltransferase [Bacteroidia bacterium]
MEIINLSENNSLLQQYVSELRDVNIQNDRQRFRKNIERIGQIMAYEISKLMPWQTVNVQTPLGMHQSKRLREQPILATILRAGLSMHHGMLSFFDNADCAFISAYRKHKDEHDFDIVVEYLASPDINNRIVLLIDPMLATGQSIDLTYRALLKYGVPQQLHVVSLIASAQGIEYLKDKLGDATLWVAAVDAELNDNGYIVPGLGDAGDLSFGEKMER